MDVATFSQGMPPNGPSIPLVTPQQVWDNPNALSPTNGGPTPIVVPQPQPTMPSPTSGSPLHDFAAANPTATGADVVALHDRLMPNAKSLSIEGGNTIVAQARQSQSQPAWATMGAQLQSGGPMPPNGPSPQPQVVQAGQQPVPSYAALPLSTSVPLSPVPSLGVQPPSLASSAAPGLSQGAPQPTPVPNAIVNPGAAVQALRANASAVPGSQPVPNTPGIGGVTAGTIAANAPQPTNTPTAGPTPEAMPTTAPGAQPHHDPWLKSLGTVLSNAAPLIAGAIIGRGNPGAGAAALEGWQQGAQTLQAQKQQALENTQKAQTLVDAKTQQTLENKWHEDESNASTSQQQYENLQAFKSGLVTKDPVTQERDVRSLTQDQLDSMGLEDNKSFFDANGKFSPESPAVKPVNAVQVRNNQIKEETNFRKMQPKDQQSMHDSYSMNPAAFEEKYGLPYNGFTPQQFQSDVNAGRRITDTEQSRGMGLAQSARQALLTRLANTGDPNLQKQYINQYNNTPAPGGTSYGKISYVPNIGENGAPNGKYGYYGSDAYKQAQIDALRSGDSARLVSAAHMRNEDAATVRRLTMADAKWAASNINPQSPNYGKATPGTVRDANTMINELTRQAETSSRHSGELSKQGNAVAVQLAGNLDKALKTASNAYESPDDKLTFETDPKGKAAAVAAFNSDPETVALTNKLNDLHDQVNNENQTTLGWNEKINAVTPPKSTATTQPVPGMNHAQRRVQNYQNGNVQPAVPGKIIPGSGAPLGGHVPKAPPLPKLVDPSASAQARAALLAN